MRGTNAHAAECLDAVRLLRDPARLQKAPAEALVKAAAVLAKGLVQAVNSGGLKPQRAQAMDMVDAARRAIGAELRRRQ